MPWSIRTQLGILPWRLPDENEDHQVAAQWTLDFQDSCLRHDLLRTDALRLDDLPGNGLDRQVPPEDPGLSRRLEPSVGERFVPFDRLALGFHLLVRLLELFPHQLPISPNRRRSAAPKHVGWRSSCEITECRSVAEPAPRRLSNHKKLTRRLGPLHRLVMSQADCRR